MWNCRNFLLLFIQTVVNAIQCLTNFEISCHFSVVKHVVIVRKKVIPPNFAKSRRKSRENLPILSKGVRIYWFLPKLHIICWFYQRIRKSRQNLPILPKVEKICRFRQKTSKIADFAKSNRIFRFCQKSTKFAKSQFCVFYFC